ncbi:DUF6296 family protein [Streptomyces sp. NPDC006879]|uniref:DUF6296 family protein n=1 Tax=Streptomyces sp. NPDC006879 TaxID=3364767 RepID=UPI00369072F3
MTDVEVYELVFADTGDPDVEPATEDVVRVRQTDRRGPGGHPVYSDDTGIVRAEISDRGEVRMLASGGHQEPRTAIRARKID